MLLTKFYVLIKTGMNVMPLKISLHVIDERLELIFLHSRSFGYNSLPRGLHNLIPAEPYHDNLSGMEIS